MAKVWVQGYTKKSGAKVVGHYRDSLTGASKGDLINEYNRVSGKVKGLVSKNKNSPYYDTNKPGKVFMNSTYVRYKKKLDGITKRLKAMGSH